MSNLVFLLLIFAGLVRLQVFLSKRKNKWLGLILPLLWVVFTVVTFLLSIFTFGSIKMTEGIDGVSQVITRTNATVLDNILLWLLPALIMNIPTFIFLAIYFACREQFKKNNELEKMNIQDLE